LNHDLVLASAGGASLIQREQGLEDRQDALRSAGMNIRTSIINLAERLPKTKMGIVAFFIGLSSFGLIVGGLLALFIQRITR
jgi:hypothetical protein